MAQRESYSLRQVSDLTGLSEFTLRGWESRYQAFQPNRTSTGRRQYSARDIKRAMMLRELLKQGHRIGNIASLSEESLNALFNKSINTKQSEHMTEHPASSEIAEIIKSISLHEWDKLRRAIRKNSAGETTLDRVRNIFLPLLASVAQLAGARTFSISQEHIFSAFLKEEIYRMISQRKDRHRETKAKFVVTTPEKDFHEIGILVAQLILVEHGFRSLYLGPNSPKEDLCETALRYGATHLLIGSTVSKKEGAKEDLYSYVHFLDKHLPPTVQIWLGGKNVSGFSPQMKRSCFPFVSMTEFEDQLKVLKR